MQVNMHQAKSQLSNLVERAEAGEEIVIARAGRPAVRLVPVDPTVGVRPLGLYAGQPFWMASDFDDTPEDVTQALEGDG